MNQPFSWIPQQWAGAVSYQLTKILANDSGTGTDNLNIAASTYFRKDELLHSGFDDKFWLPNEIMKQIMQFKTLSNVLILCQCVCVCVCLCVCLCVCVCACVSK